MVETEGEEEEEDAFILDAATKPEKAHIATVVDKQILELWMRVDSTVADTTNTLHSLSPSPS